MHLGVQLRSQPLPPPILEMFVDAIREERAVRSDLAVSVDVRDAAVADLPDVLRIRIVIQPIVDLDVVEATF